MSTQLLVTTMLHNKVQILKKYEQHPSFAHSWGGKKQLKQITCVKNQLSIAKHSKHLFFMMISKSTLQ
jgi:hypothetical protein